MKKMRMDGQLSLFPDDAFENDPNNKPATEVDDNKQQKKEGQKEDKRTANTNKQEYAGILDTLTAEKISPEEHYDHSALFEHLAKSDFRSGFHLKSKDAEYIRVKGIDTIRQHAADFVAKRLAPAYITNDGKQTPMRGHPVFIAQHATGCCCRGCFYKWHHIVPGRQLTIKEQRYAVSVLMAWIEKEYQKTNNRK